MTYQQYKKEFYAKRKNGFSSQPMSEKDFRAMMGIKDDNFHEAFIARKSSSQKCIKPTFSTHTSLKNE
jgi:hypothetical protein